MTDLERSERSSKGKSKLNTCAGDGIGISKVFHEEARRALSFSIDFTCSDSDSGCNAQPSQMRGGS
jgi:hypothetical protein